MLPSNLEEESEYETIEFDPMDIADFNEKLHACFEAHDEPRLVLALCDFHRWISDVQMPNQIPELIPSIFSVLINSLDITDQTKFPALSAIAELVVSYPESLSQVFLQNGYIPKLFEFLQPQNPSDYDLSCIAISLTILMNFVSVNKEIAKIILQHDDILKEMLNNNDRSVRITSVVLLSNMSIHLWDIQTMKTLSELHVQTICQDIDILLETFLGIGNLVQHGGSLCLYNAGLLSAAFSLDKLPPNCLSVIFEVIAIVSQQIDSVDFDIAILLNHLDTPGVTLTALHALFSLSRMSDSLSAEICTQPIIDKLAKINESGSTKERKYALSIFVVIVSSAPSDLVLYIASLSIPLDMLDFIENWDGEADTKEIFKMAIKMMLHAEQVAGRTQLKERLGDAQI